MKPVFGHSLIIWTLFFVICMSLGYPTLNRYDPRAVPGLSDSNGYYALVTDGSDAGEESHRILVPYLAKPIYRLVDHRLHTWNPISFSVLAVNSFFSATTAFLLVVVGRRIVRNDAVALIGAFVYLTDFAVSNLNLSGYVDSSVNCLLMAIVWSLLPLRGLVGALAKETFVPLAVVLAFGWWLTASRRGALRLSQLAWIGAMAIVGFGTLSLLMAHSSPPSSPLSFAASRWAGSGSGYLYLSGLYRCLMAREFLFTFAWLVPLGLWRISRLPSTWVIGSTCAALAALAMGAYDDAMGNAARAVFSAVGPFLSLSVSLLLVETGARSTLSSELER